MKVKYITIGVVILVIGLAPYAASVFNYRGAGGSVANIGGIQYNYVYVDRTHFQSPKVLIYPKDYVSSVRSGQRTINVDGKDVEFGRDRVLLLKPDKSVVRLGWSKEWFVTSTKYTSDIYGIFGAVPHFKDYQIEYPDPQQFRKLIEQNTHNDVMHADPDEPRR